MRESFQIPSIKSITNNWLCVRVCSLTLIVFLIWLTQFLNRQYKAATTLTQSNAPWKVAEVLLSWFYCKPVSGRLFDFIDDNATVKNLGLLHQAKKQQWWRWSELLLMSTRTSSIALFTLWGKWNGWLIAATGLSMDTQWKWK